MTTRTNQSGRNNHARHTSMAKAISKGMTGTAEDNDSPFNWPGLGNRQYAPVIDDLVDRALANYIQYRRDRGPTLKVMFRKSPANINTGGKTIHKIRMEIESKDRDKTYQ